MIYQLLLLALVSLLAADSTTATEWNSDRHKRLRLPSTTYPVHYSLRLEMPTDLDRDDHYTGQVIISINAALPTDLIVLHCDSGILVHNVDLKWHDVDIPVAIVEHDPETQFLKVYISTPMHNLTDEVYQLLIDFSGTMDRYGSHGFVKQNFKELGEGDTPVKRFYAMTAFEPTFARKAFPCYDEPEYKATFDISVMCGKKYNVHSNGALLEEQDLDQVSKLVRFNRTPPMASYLVAIFVSTFGETVRDSDGVKIGMLTSPVGGSDSALEFALNVTEKSLQALQGYTGQRYFFSKLDLVGVQGISGGVENWGLIMYHENYLLVDQQSDFSAKIASVGLISHEVAHQFFGNLVGITWWDHLWLKEGLAMFVSHRLTLQFLPEAYWAIKLQYDRNTWTVMNYDSGPLTHAMQYRVQHPDDILALYSGDDSAIVYEKSFRVVRMMEQALGRDVLRAGIQKYIATNQFRAVHPSSLYQSLHEFAVASSAIVQGIHVSEIFNSWVDQAGHPIVYVERIGNSKKYRFTQRPFKACPCSPGSRWWIPIFISSYGSDKELDAAPDFWLPATTTFIIETTIDAALPLVNARSYGFYRVSYCQQGWNEILDNWYRIDGSARAKLLDDGFSLQWDQGTFFEPLFLMLDKLQNDTDPLPWIAAMADHNLGQWVRLSLGRTDVEQDMKSLAKRLTSNMLTLFSQAWSSDGVEALNLALKWACRLEMPSCQKIEHSGNDNEICHRLVSPDYMSRLRCDRKFVETLLHAVDFATCFTSLEWFQQFVDNMLQNYRCSEMLKLFVAAINAGIPHIDELLEKLTVEVGHSELIIGGQNVEVFLRTAAYYIYHPRQQQLMIRFMELLDDVTEAQRIGIRNIMAAQIFSASGVSTSLKQYLNNAEIVANYYNYKEEL